jgi:hypothetical protein
MPEALRLLPLYILSALKTNALRLLSSSRQLDNKVYCTLKMLRNGLTKMAYQLYPRIYPITDITDALGNTMGFDSTPCGWGFYVDEAKANLVVPKTTSASRDSIHSDGAYIIDDGEYINLFVGSDVPEEFV